METATSFTIKTSLDKALRLSYRTTLLDLLFQFCQKIQGFERGEAIQIDLP